MKVRPLNDNVFVQYLPGFQTETDSGILLTRSQEDEAYGFVLFAPEGADVEKDDVIVFLKKDAQITMLEGKEQIVLKLSDIMGKVEE